MGAITSNLIPPAILYNNPVGLSFEDFFLQYNQAIDNIYGASSWNNLPVNGVAPSAGTPYLKNNRHNFASQILCLKLSKQYLKLMEEFFDDELKYVRQELFSGLDNDEYEVHKTKRQVQGLEIIKNTFLSTIGKEAYRPGDYIYEREENIVYFVKEVLDTKAEGGEYDGYIVEQKLRVSPIKTETTIESIPDTKELEKRYPYYALDKMFDFTKSGELYPANTLVNLNTQFQWSKKDDLYRLDYDCLNEILSFNSLFGIDARSDENGQAKGDGKKWVHNVNGNKSKRVFSLTDLVLTAQAVKKKSWKAFTFSQIRTNYVDFLLSSKDLLRAYEDAVIDTELSVICTKERRTVTDFLRKRVMMECTRKELDLDVARVSFERWLKEEERERKKKERFKQEIENNEQVLLTPFG